MTTPATIRLAGPEDAATVLALIQELAEYEKLAHEVVATVDSIRDTLFAADGCSTALLAECDGAAVGFAVYFRTYSTFLGREGIYLEDVYVQPAARGQGIGKQLLAAAAAAANRLGGRLEWSVLDWNQPSIDFYESLGAVQHSEWLKYRITGEPLAELAKRSAGR
ncbi:MAG: GNAT family N-acetyltransferase [Planctomycetaceae bacterium]|nr:GNAT family N-acetyltransferase [Planctomycetaceae bacterium]